MFDADNGGALEQLPYVVKNLERLGVSAMVMEDKVGSKKILYLMINLDLNKTPFLIFVKKLKLATKSRITNDLLVIAKLKALF